MAAEAAAGAETAAVPRWLRVPRVVRSPRLLRLAARPVLLGLLIVLWAATLPTPAGADALDAVNWVRQRGCGASNLSPLRNNALLGQAASRIAAGASLHSALQAAGYFAAQSSELHLSGAVADADVSRLLKSHYCAMLTDPALREIGVERRGRELWMVLSAPLSVPTPADASAVSQRVLDLVNAARAAGRRCGSQYFAPVASLTLNPALTAAALDHSRDMARYGAFDHRGHDGSMPAIRVQRAGYGAARIVGENIAAGVMSPAEVMQGWLESPAHCENIMDGRFTQIGIAYASNLSSAAGLYWTQDFAARR